MDIINKTTKNGVFIIAELSANHGHKKETAIESIKAAKRAGANCIKLQTYTPDTITLKCGNDYFKIDNGTIWDGRTLYDLYEEAFTPWDWHYDLFKVANDEGLLCFSSPFDNSAVDFLEQFNPFAYKIASFEITDIPLIKYVASKKRPVIISTGVAELSDIELAIKSCKDVGNDQIILLKCTSSYPAPIEDANLLTIPEMISKFGLKCGLSDHTLGIISPVVAVSLGASVIEKHFIMDKSIGGPDSSFSLDEKEFTEMVLAVRQAEKALGKVNFDLSKKIRSTRRFARSLFVVKDVAKGEDYTLENIRSIRPGYGLHPKFLNQVLGKKAKSNIKLGTPLSWDIIG